jgi:type II secretory ATPase GspE/PulE/Tfp pilus assembly ATPase PilB-like protein
MLAGTFNLVMAERLVRKICNNCKKEVIIKNDPKYKYAKKSIEIFNKELLKKEM